MMFGYPPRKARDENELLKGIKTITITHILKRSNLSPRANDFLKKTLAYSEEERIGWNDLFEMFREKSMSPERTMEPSSVEHARQVHNSKERGARLISNGNNSWSQQQLTPQSANTISNNGIGNNSYSNRQIISSGSQNQVMKS
mgnify:FL=1